MHLTLDSLHNVKKTCSEIQGFEGLMNAEDRMRINEEIISLRNAVDQALETVNVIEHLRGSLESCGYSEEWFDNACSMGMKDLVQIDMPKFFDNKANRGQACMEAFVDTLKSWIKQAWEFIKRLMGKIRDITSWLVKQLNIRKTVNDGILKFVDDTIDKKVDQYFSKKHGIDLNNWVELSGLGTHIDNISCVINVVTDFTTLDQIGTNISEFANGDRDTIRRQFSKDICVKISQAGVQDCTNPDNGFVVNPSTSNASVVQFYDLSIPGRTYKREKFSLRSPNEVQELISNLKDCVTKKDDLNNILTTIDGKIKGHAVVFQNEINAEMTKVVQDNEKLNLLRHLLRVTQLAISVVTDALTYVSRVNNYIDTDIALVGAMAKAMNNVNP